MELAGVGVVFVELAVASPVDGDVELVAGFFVGEAASEDVEEESFGEVAVDRCGEGVVDGSDERRAFGGFAGEELFGGEDVGDDELASVVGDLDVGVVDGGEAEQGGAVDEGEQVVDFEHEVVGEGGEVFGAAAGEQDFQEAGHAADGRGRKRFVDRRRSGRVSRALRRACSSSRPVMMP